MPDPGNSNVLSAPALARRQAMLPGLLTAVRVRRRRRQALRAVAALLAVGVVGFLLRPSWFAAEPAGVPRLAAAPTWTSFGDDPTVLARCEVRAPARADWFVDDRALQVLLATTERPAGLVRAGGRVLLPADAVDRWQAEAP